MVGWGNGVQSQRELNAPPHAQAIHQLGGVFQSTMPRRRSEEEEGMPVPCDRSSETLSYAARRLNSLGMGRTPEGSGVIK